jgi:hypothetical protein
VIYVGHNSIPEYQNISIETSERIQIMTSVAGALSRDETARHHRPEASAGLHQPVESGSFAVADPRARNKGRTLPVRTLRGALVNPLVDGVDAAPVAAWTDPAGSDLYGGTELRIRGSGTGNTRSCPALQHAGAGPDVPHHVASGTSSIAA